MSVNNVTGNTVKNFNFQEFISSGFVLPQTFNGSINPTGATAATVNYTNGTGSLQLDLLHCKPYTLSGATTTIDLTALADLDGVNQNFARVREFYLFNPDTNSTHDVKAYAGGSNGWAQLPPSTSPLYARNNGGNINLSDPVSTGGGNGNVVSGTSKTITLDPGANTVTVYLLIAGTSVA